MKRKMYLSVFPNIFSGSWAAARAASYQPSNSLQPRPSQGALDRNLLMVIRIVVVMSVWIVIPWNGHRKDSTLLMIININHDDHHWHNDDHLSWRRWTCEVRFVKISTPWKRDATCQHRWGWLSWSSWWFLMIIWWWSLFFEIGDYLVMFNTCISPSGW